VAGGVLTGYGGGYGGQSSVGPIVAPASAG
jgi:hypothetical protein